MPDNRGKLVSIIESKKKINNRYDDIKGINPQGGDGHFSLVFTAKDMLSRANKMVALKFLNPSFAKDNYSAECFHREIKILSSFRGQKNIIPIIGEKNELEIILSDALTGIELPLQLLYHITPLANYSIRQYISSGERNYLKNILFFKEMCKAVQRLHNNEICHRDLKPSNFLVMKQRYVCVSDFGLARSYAEGEPELKDYYSRLVGDARYGAPELICGLFFSKKHNFCADIYSLGAILFELFTNNILGSLIFPFDERCQMMRDFKLTPEEMREYMVNEVIGDIAEKIQLPSVSLYDDIIPKSIAHQIDMLYKSMAAIDYRKREVNFSRIFLRIEIAKKVIAHELKVKKIKKLGRLRKGKND